MSNQASKTALIRDYLRTQLQSEQPLYEGDLLLLTGWKDVERTLRQTAKKEGVRLKKERDEMHGAYYRPLGEEEPAPAKKETKGKKKPAGRNRVVFPAEQARQLAQTAVDRKRPLYFVHDSGVYLCVRGKKKSDTRVLFADGLNPEEQDPAEVHERAARAVGGDDFAEKLAAADLAAAPAEGAEWMVIEVTATQLKVYFQ
jgi:hypothetical protein